MRLSEEFVRSGNQLFRWRSYLPLMLVGLLVAAAWVGAAPARAGNTVWGWQTVCVLVSLAGLAIRAVTIGYSAKGTSGRNTRAQKAENLNTTGIYSLVRHPLYVGNFLMALGPFMYTRVWWAFVLYGLTFWLYYERIMFAEERYLHEQFGDAFESWSDATPAFLPKFGNYSRPSLPFSFRKVLRREYSGLLAITVTFAVVEFIRHAASAGRMGIGVFWTVALAGAAVAYLVLRFLKKRTRVLVVENR